MAGASGHHQTGRMVIERTRHTRPVRRSATRLAALAVVVLGLVIAVPVAEAASGTATATKLGSSVTFHGKGAGHGVGMSQYGARGRAKAGETATQILAAYYRTARRATTDPDQVVRVLLLDRAPATTDDPLVIHGRGGPWTVDDVEGTFPADAELRVWQPDVILEDVPTPGPLLEVTDAAGTTLVAATPSPAKVVARPADPLTRLQLDAKGPTNSTYRGALKLVLDGPEARVINRVGLDDYLRGVLPAEMPSRWPRAALRAQAIASRSYAVRRLHPGSGAFDLFADTRTQVYLGVDVETDRTNAIIDGDPGAILVKGKHDRAINAFYHSTGGGATENNEYAFVGSSGAVTASPVKYLRGIDDVAADGTPFDATSPYATWKTATLTRAQLSTIFGKDARTDVGSLNKLDLTHRGVSGRLYRVTLIGNKGLGEDGVGERVRQRLQRRPASRQRRPAQHAVRHPADQVGGPGGRGRLRAPGGGTARCRPASTSPTQTTLQITKVEGRRGAREERVGGHRLGVATGGHQQHDRRLEPVDRRRATGRRWAASTRIASAAPASGVASNRTATLPSTPTNQPRPNRTTVMAPAAIAGSRVPRASASVSTVTASNARNPTATSGSGGTWPLTRSTTAMANRPDRIA